MRNFLPNVKIVGAMLISREGEILHYSIQNLLKWCDWIVLMMDNEDRKTRRIAKGYRSKYPDKVRLRYSGFPRASERQEDKKAGLFHRFKGLQGAIRECVFHYLRQCRAGGEKIDIILFPDADEVFTDYLPAILDLFWRRPNIKGVTMKPVDVYRDFKTLRGRSMIGHTRILKFSWDLTAVPYRTGCYYIPLSKDNRMRCNRANVHLASLTPDKMSWRVAHWKAVPKDEEPLWCLSKDVREMTPDEILKELEKPPTTTVEEYRKKLC